MPTTAGAPPGSGANFKALSSKLAGRGVKNPGALAAYIGRKKYGRKGFAKLGQMGRAHAHTADELLAILLAGGSSSKCPNCGYEADDAEFKVSDSGASGTSLERSPGELRTPAPEGLQSAAGFGAGAGLNVRGSSGGHALAGMSPAISLATPSIAITSPWDVLVSRGETGAVVRHRRGGQELGTITRDEVGRWVATVNGQAQSPHTHQRAALADIIGINNRAAGSPHHRPQSEQLQPPPAQTPLMQQFGIPAVRALATPSNGASDGPRETASSGLTPKGEGIYKKLRARGFPHERALAFAKRSQNMGAGSFKKAS